MNKKALLALAFAGLLTLAGCGGPEDPSASSGSPDSTGTDTSTPQPGVQPVDPDADPWGLGYTARDVYDAIADISSNLCYAFEFEIDGDTYQEIHTSEYSYSNLTDAGYLALPHYADSSKSLYYQYAFDVSGNVVPGRALNYLDDATGEYVGIETAADADCLSLICSPLSSFALTDIKSYQKGYVTDSADLILILSTFMGVSAYQSAIASITFQMEEDGLTFTFQPNFLDGYEMIDGLGGTFSKIGSARYTPLENFLSSYSLPEAMPATGSSFLSQSTLSLDSLTTRVYEKEGIATLETTSYARSTTGAFTSKRYGNPPTLHEKLYSKAPEGSANWDYVSMDNEVRSVDLGVAFDSFLRDPWKYFEPAAFRATEKANVYRYYGYQGRWLINAFCQYDVGLMETLEVTLGNDGSIVSMYGRTPTLIDSAGNGYYTQATVNFVAPRSLPTLSRLEATSETEEIAGVLALMDGSIPFHASLSVNGLSAYSTEVTVADGIYLQMVNEHDTDPGADGAMIQTYTGYEVTATGATPFAVEFTVDPETYETSGTAKASDNALAGVTMKDLIGFTGSPAVFEKDDKGAIKVRPLVDSLASGIMAGTFADYIIPDSFRLTLSSTGKPLSISYYFSMDDGFYAGKEEILFSSFGTATLPENIDFSNIGTWNAPTKWGEELKASQYKILCDMFGKDWVDTLPYLYDRQIAGGWQLTDDTPEGYSRIHLFNMKEDASPDFEKNHYEVFAKAYAAMLEDLGYEVSSDNAWGMPAYTDGVHFIRITYLADSQVDFFIFDKNLK